MTKQNITVRRYADPSLAWEACIEPDDGSWLLFVRRDGGPPVLWTPAPTA